MKAVNYVVPSSSTQSRWVTGAVAALAAAGPVSTGLSSVLTESCGVAALSGGVSTFVGQITGNKTLAQITGAAVLAYATDSYVPFLLPIVASGLEYFVKPIASEAAVNKLINNGYTQEEITRANQINEVMPVAISNALLASISSNGGFSAYSLAGSVVGSAVGAWAGYVSGEKAAQACR